MLILKIPRRTIEDWSIAVYIFLSMVSSSTGNLSVKIGRIILTFILLMYFFGRKKILLKDKQYIVWNIIFLIYAFVGCFFAFSKSYAFSFTLTLAYVVICNIMLAMYISLHIEMVDFILKIIIISAIYKAFICYIQNGLLVFLTVRYIGETSANTIGLYCAIAGVLSVYFIMIENKKTLYWISLVLNIIFMILSASRKAILYFGIPIMVFWILKSKNSLKIIRNIFLSIIATMIFFLLVLNVSLLYELIGWRIEGAINGLINRGNVDGSTQTRLSLIAFGLKYYKKQPIFGYGISNFRALCAAYRSWGSEYYAHNNYVELLVDCGIVGFIIYYFLHVNMLYNMLTKWKKLSKRGLILFGVLISILICDYGIVSYYNIFIHLMLLLIYFEVHNKFVLNTIHYKNSQMRFKYDDKQVP